MILKALCWGTSWVTNIRFLGALARDPAAHASLDDPHAVGILLDALRLVGAADQVAGLASRAAAHMSLDDPHAVAALRDALRDAGAQT